MLSNLAFSPKNQANLEPPKPQPAANHPIRKSTKTVSIQCLLLEDMKNVTFFKKTALGNKLKSQSASQSNHKLVLTCEKDIQVQDNEPLIKTKYSPLIEKLLRGIDKSIQTDTINTRSGSCQTSFSDKNQEKIVDITVANMVSTEDKVRKEQSMLPFPVSADKEIQVAPSMLFLVTKR